MANPHIKSIIQNATFDQALFAEEVTYNGNVISAIVEIGENEQQNTNGFMRSPNTAVVFGSSFITVKLDDVPDPKRTDKIIYNGKTFHVAGIELVDSVGGNVTLKVTSNERGYISL